MSLNQKQILIITAGIVLILAVMAVLVYVPREPGVRDVREVAIESGQGLSGIAKILKDSGVIRSRILFVIYVALSGQESKLKAGRYSLSPGQSIPKIASLIAEGKAESDDIEVLIPEGSNVWEVDQIFAAAKLITAGQIAQAFGHKEGHLFPDTYRFERKAKGEKEKVEEIVNKLEETYYAKAQTRSDVAVIIASMLEKEAKSDEDMRLVGGIIEKRLELGMLLQIDATVAYGWCVRRKTAQYRDCDVTQAPLATEIKVDGPYNTYTRKGLPQGAISNPGVRAIQAAQNPTKSDYLYYLSTRDGSQIIYSKNAAEHAANRKKYLGL